MILRLAHDPKVAAAVFEEAAATGEPETVVSERVRRYAREIVPSFSATVYFTVGIRLAKWIARMLYHVRLIDHRLSPIDPKATDSLQNRVHSCWVNPAAPPAPAAAVSDGGMQTVRPGSPQGGRAVRSCGTDESRWCRPVLRFAPVR